MTDVTIYLTSGKKISYKSRKFKEDIEEYYMLLLGKEEKALRIVLDNEIVIVNAKNITHIEID